ncbi:MAG: rRNA maturation RNase YbeY [Planctomycetes bacterium]|nr:rRNA maturation RNase YbeY [Planctomycetota bacterium]MCH9726429.1 rRNA maturation RNase YbeY [Planctomycetota bacterium]MCH9778238.1 rRNA maturation RNase YbeY [Planctomycetota bacterium]MDF1745676.1 rRNA maturation RNase YbeY [Gimesia sp.]
MNKKDQFLIRIQNSQSHLSIDEALLQETVCFLLQSENVVRADISLAIIDNATIRKLNQQYLDHDYNTDVLSFLLECQSDLEKQVPELRGAGKTIEGEVLVSAEMASDMSENYDWSAENELLLYVVHGVLHLCGYDDLTAEELNLMRTKEQQFFDHKALSIPRQEE